MNAKFEISVKSIFVAAAVVIGLWTIVEIRDILYLLFISFLLMTAIYPLVTTLEKVRIPRIVSILLIYAIVFGFIGASILSAIPALIIQSNHLVASLPEFVLKVAPNWNIDLTTVTQQIAPIGENLLKVTLGIFSNIATTLTVLVFTFYFLLERPQARSVLTDVLGEQIAGQVVDVARAVELRLGSWVRGQLLLMISVGVFCYIGLLILHIEFALPLAILAGLLEIVPTVGPIISAVPAILVGLGTSPFLALSVAALYFVIQQLENNLFVPVIMKRSVGFSPLVTILALMIGAKVAGVTGAILGVPATLVAQTLVTSILAKTATKSAKVPSKNPPKS